MAKSRKNRSTGLARRPRWLLPALIVAAAALVLAFVAALTGGGREAFVPQVTGAPRAEVDQDSIDHGFVRFEQPVESVFRVRNIGDESLTIMGEPRVELLQGC